MTFAETLTLAAYFFVLIILAVYGWHRYYLVYLFLRYRDREARPGAPLSPQPPVTIQLPLYNEMYVADRLIEAVARIH
jgi:cellulose synthase/poly-beta-1,6-N-acetylglucosamine synthase-like glycosyltransferase